MAELVGADVEFPVGQSLIFKHHRHRLRRALHLLFEQLVDTFVPWIFPLRPVPFYQDLLPLGVAQQRRLRNLTIGLRQQGLQQRLEVTGHLLDRGTIEQVAVVFPEQIDTVATRGRVGADTPFLRWYRGDVQIEFRRTVMHHRQMANPQVRRLCLRQRRVMEIKHHLKQRMMAIAALWHNGFNHPVKRGILVGVCFSHRLAHPVHQLAECGIPRQIVANDQVVEDHSDELLCLRPTAIGNSNAYAEILLAAVAMQQDGECGLHCHEWCGAVAATGAAQRFVDVAGQDLLD